MAYRVGEDSSHAWVTSLTFTRDGKRGRSQILTCKEGPMALRGTEFENRLDMFGGDARACASFAYTELTFRHALRADRDLAKQMDAHRGFWRQLRAALRTSLFATLARIYDESRNSNSAGQFLRFCEGHREIFSRPSRIARQTAGHEIAVPRARTAFEPEPGVFAPLFAELDRMRCFYHRAVQPVQARLLRAGFGAADHVDVGGLDELGGSEFAELAVFPLRLHRALEALYRDGRPPALADVPMTLEAILAGHPAAAAAWEHVRAARNTAAFLRSQRFAQLGLDALAADESRYLEEEAPYLEETSRAFARAGAGPA
jgi:hypothetical protein